MLTQAVGDQVLNGRQRDPARSHDRHVDQPARLGPPVEQRAGHLLEAETRMIRMLVADPQPAGPVLGPESPPGHDGIEHRGAGRNEVEVAGREPACRMKRNGGAAYQDGVVNQWTGTGKYAGRGVRRALLRIAEEAAVAKVNRCNASR